MIYRCFDTLKQYAQTIKGLPGHLEEKVRETLEKAKDAYIHKRKLAYLRSLVDYVGDSIDKWTSDL